MKNYTMTVNNVTINLKAKHNVEAIHYAGSFGIKADDGVTSLIDEDGNRII